MRSPFRLTPAVLLLLVAGAPRVTRATIMVALDLPQLVEEADHIAVVEVAGVKAAWDERHERIYSTVDFNVIERWKSPAGGADVTGPTDRLTVVQPGGTVGDITMTVIGMGTFAPGERSLVFLRGPAGRAQVVGMTQGKRPVRFEPASRRWLVARPDLRQTKLVRPPGASTPAAPRSTLPMALPPGARLNAAAPANSARPMANPDMPLDDMRSEVRRLLGTNVP